MRDLVREKFEKWFKAERQQRQGSGNEIIQYVEMYEAGHSSRDEQVSSLRTDVDALNANLKLQDKINADLQVERDELKAHVCSIVAAAEYVIGNYDIENNIVGYAERSNSMDELLTAIASTPSQSLAEVRKGGRASAL